jgi:hypothetical protein
MLFENIYKFAPIAAEDDHRHELAYLKFCSDNEKALSLFEYFGLHFHAIITDKGSMLFLSVTRSNRI